MSCPLIISKASVVVESGPSRLPVGPGSTPSPWPVRPLTRGDCLDGPRPCPWVSCRYHLGWEHREIKRLMREGSLEEAVEAIACLPATCALDCAESGALSSEQVGPLVGVTRQAVDQILLRVVKKHRSTFQRILGDFDAED